VCCHFVSGSHCVLRPRDDAVALVEELRERAAAAVDAAGGQRAWYNERHAHYVQHECVGHARRAPPN
jgi:hypothetical protein